MKTRDTCEVSVPPSFPRRREDLHVEELDGEAVLYDPQNGAVHRFNTATFFVWSASDGSRTMHDIADGLVEHHSLGPDEALSVVRHAVTLIAEADLLHGDSFDAHNAFDDVAFASTTPEAPAPNQPTMREGPDRPPVAVAALETEGGGLSRRELLSGGVKTVVLTAPVISTFFAAGAYASGPSASGAFGTGGCKTIGYSCTVNNDCCEPNTKTACQDGVCCVQHNEAGCTTDADCCNGPDVCNAGTCE